MRPGVRLGIDVGQRRVGVARTDSTGTLAIPLETIARSTEESDWSGVVARIRRLVDEYEAIEVVVGLPLSLSGSDTQSTRDARAFAQFLQPNVDSVPVRLIDERLSTVSASQNLREAGVAGRKQRNVIDQQAAVVILEHALDIERRSGLPAGRAVSDSAQ